MLWYERAMPHVHPLTHYLLAESMSITDLARRAHCSRSYLSRYISGKVDTIGAEVAYRLQAATKGRVPAMVLIEWGRTARARPPAPAVDPALKGGDGSPVPSRGQDG